MPLFLMSPPRSDWHLQGRANVFSRAPHPATALGAQAARDWLHLADAIVRAGGDVAVIAAPADPALTGMPYVAEAGQLGADAGGRVFLVANVTPPHRRAEAAHIHSALAAWGLRTRDIAVPWEGQGDVIRVGLDRSVCTSGEGPYARTHQAAFALVAPHLAGRLHHARFRADPWFHGNTFLGAFAGPRGTVVLVCEDALEPSSLGSLRAFLEGVWVVPITRAESLAYATNALVVNHTVLAPAGLRSRIHDVWREVGLVVEELALPALFGRGGGAGVCLTNRLDGLALADVPAAHHYAAVRDSIARGARETR